MKKLFIAVLAVAGLASCMQDEVLSQDQAAIEFGDAFVDNSTKAIIDDAGGIDGFTVWGNVNAIDATTNPVALYGETGATVSRDGKGLGVAWSCSEKRYWTASCVYNFVAIANYKDVVVVNGVPTQIGYAVDATEPADLIYGATAAKTNADCAPILGVNANKVVNFTMKHLLSRIKVSYKNLVEGGDYTFDVTSAKITTWAEGVYTIANDVADGTPWVKEGTNNVELTYDNVTSLAYSTTATLAGDKLVIPGSAVTLEITYNEKLEGNVYRTATITKEAIVVPVQNYSYNIIVEFAKDNAIEFTIDATNGLTNWNTQADQPIQ